ncbi:YjbH domain-containing protein [Maritalea mobilis]|uniref:YjbH domain-containing protein n=1 Tax=Maritalea mobilis TaxID=483324 RepID=UPI001C953C05|nr:YjbH domain-containing protein [Maritalea mobilis]MBY6200853.1 YjbH domain-containing protein [Maritalea mobilis]
MPTLNYYGLPGLVDMPTANVMPDADLSLTGSYVDGTLRGTIAFQVMPRLTATFRYAAIPEFTPDSTPINQDYYLDRSFDLHWQILDEDSWWPSLAVGIRDIAGTGVYGGEYIVATRHFGADDRLAVTAGLGFGRLGERDGFANPFGLGNRPPRDFGLGGTVNFDQFFRGDAAVFGGVEYQASDRLRLQLEYSTDIYTAEAADGVIEIESPINLGATYDMGRYGTIGAHYLYGTTFGLSYSLSTNPRRGAFNGTLDAAPEPVRPRPVSAEPYATSWVSQPDGAPILRDNVERLFEEDGGLELVSLSLDPQRATIRVRNIRYGQEAMALGRVLRVLSVTMPNSVEVFEVIFIVNGADASRVRVNRSDVEALEHDVNGASGLMARADVEPAGRVGDPDTITIRGTTPDRLTWGIGPYVETALFDPDAPFRGDLGLEAQARFEFGRGFVAEGALRVPLIGNLSDARVVDGVEPGGPFPVRSESALYYQESEARLDRLTLSHYGRLGDDLYTRLTFGYMERMFAGASAEVLWQRVDSRLGLGVELNHVWRRDFDGGFGLQDYSVTSGHVSAYFPIFGDFTGQVDVGRYLAGDYGATLRVDREFANGWRVGAFATFTDVSFDEFGEGSFDKGIELTVPLGWFTGTSSRSEQTTTLRPILRDGGARLSVEGRLHDLIPDYHQPALEETEAMLWR